MDMNPRFIEPARLRWVQTSDGKWHIELVAEMAGGLGMDSKILCGEATPKNASTMMFRTETPPNMGPDSKECQECWAQIAMLKITGELKDGVSLDSWDFYTVAERKNEKRP